MEQASESLPEKLRAALQAVLDPELGESIVDLGLVDRIEVDGDRIAVVLIATSATCPMSDVLLDDATTALQRAAPAGMSVAVRMDHTQPWSPQRMSADLQQRFGWQDGEG